MNGVRQMYIHTWASTAVGSKSTGSVALSSSSKGTFSRSSSVGEMSCCGCPLT